MLEIELNADIFFLQFPSNFSSVEPAQVLDNAELRYNRSPFLDYAIAHCLLCDIINTESGLVTAKKNHVNNRENCCFI